MLNIPTYISNPSYPTKKKTKADIIKNYKRNGPQIWCLNIWGEMPFKTKHYAGQKKKKKHWMDIITYLCNYNIMQ